MTRKRINDVWKRIQREAAEADRANIDCFENRSPTPEELESQELNLAQLEGFEKAVNEWIDRQHGQQRKTKAVDFFAGMLARLRRKIGVDDQTLNRLEELDRIGMQIVSDSIATHLGDSSIVISRVAPRVSNVCLEGEIACRKIVFKHAFSGTSETRQYAISGTSRKCSGLSIEEDYALALIQTILGEISKPDQKGRFSSPS